MSFAPSHDPRFRSSQHGIAAVSVLMLSCLQAAVPIVLWRESGSTSHEHSCSQLIPGTGRLADSLMYDRCWCCDSDFSMH